MEGRDALAKRVSAASGGADPIDSERDSASANVNGGGRPGRPPPASPGQLTLQGAKLTGANQNRQSLIADDLEVIGAAFLDEGFTAAGAVRLHVARLSWCRVALRGLAATTKSGTGACPGRRHCHPP